MEDHRARLFDTYISTHFGEIRDISIHALERQRVFFRAYFGRLLPGSRDANILDIGCGFGSFLYFLQKEGYRNAHGVDISPEQVEAARSLGIANVHCEDLITFVENREEEFDGITALDVVEHFPKEEVLPLLDSVNQALKPGGVFIMQSPNASGPFGSAHRYSDFSHEIVFTKESVTQVLRVAGFTGVEVHPTGPVVHGLSSAGRWVLWRAIRLLLQAYLLVETGTWRGHILTQDLIAVARKPNRAKDRL